MIVVDQSPSSLDNFRGSGFQSLKVPAIPTDPMAPAQLNSISVEPEREREKDIR